MNYRDFGLVNTSKMFADAIARKYAVPAFNFYNMETLKSVMDAAQKTNSPVILAVSESGLKYMGADMLMGMIAGATIAPRDTIALHLDHGANFDICKTAIDLGFSSVMFDGSHLPFNENIAQTKQVVEYAHKHGVTVEAELGVLAGIEDSVSADKNIYTNPSDVIEFVKRTNCDSLAIAIGTSHGAYKRKSDNEKLRFDILNDIAKKLPKFPLVLHGASSIPPELVLAINKFGGKIKNARGIPTAQLRRAVSMNICKINVDSDARLAFTAAVRKSLSDYPENFDPRKFLTLARDAMTEVYVHEIRQIMNSGNKLKV